MDAAFAAADRFLADAPEPKLPISGADLIARGVEAGPPVGRALRAFQALWIRAGFPKGQETLTRLIEQAVVELVQTETVAAAGRQGRERRLGSTCPSAERFHETAHTRSKPSSFAGLLR